jgi:hypothetical protein
MVDTQCFRGSTKPRSAGCESTLRCRKREEGHDPYERKRDDTDRTAAWRARMKTKSAHAIYTQRAATAETINADQQTWRGMHQFGVRGTAKVSCVVLLAALMRNILRAHAVWGQWL